MERFQHASTVKYMLNTFTESGSYSLKYNKVIYTIKVMIFFPQSIVPSEEKPLLGTRKTDTVP